MKSIVLKNKTQEKNKKSTFKNKATRLSEKLSELKLYNIHKSLNKLTKKKPQLKERRKKINKNQKFLQRSLLEKRNHLSLENTFKSNYKLDLQCDKKYSSKKIQDNLPNKSKNNLNSSSNISNCKSKSLFSQSESKTGNASIKIKNNKIQTSSEFVDFLNPDGDENLMLLIKIQGIDFDQFRPWNRYCQQIIDEGAEIFDLTSKEKATMKIFDCKCLEPVFQSIQNQPSQKVEFF